MKDTSFSNGGFSGRAPAAVGVVEYATVTDLNTASEGALPAGYYSVPNVGVTYWDGATFFPYLSVGAEANFDAPLQAGRLGIIDTYSSKIIASVDADMTVDADLHLDIDAGTAWSTP